MDETLVELESEGDNFRFVQFCAYSFALMFVIIKCRVEHNDDRFPAGVLTNYFSSQKHPENSENNLDEIKREVARI